MLVKMLDRIQKNTLWRYVYTRIPFLVPTLGACVTESRSEHFYLGAHLFEVVPLFAQNRV